MLSAVGLPMRSVFGINSILLVVCVQVLVGLGNAFAQPTYLPTASDLHLIGTFEPQKPWYLPYYENHHGEELDMSEKRPAVNLAGTVFEAKYGKPGYDLWANLYHMGEFYIVRVPHKGAKNAYAQEHRFGPEINRPPLIEGFYPAGHGLIRVEMDDNSPIEIVSKVPSISELQELEELGSPEAQVAALPEALSGSEWEIKNVGISGEAHWSKEDSNQSYNVLRGAKGAYVMVIRFVSQTERALKFLQESGRPVLQFKLPVPDRGMSEYLHEGLILSEREGKDKFYGSLLNNCYGVLFNIIESATGLRDRRFGFIRDTLQERMPIIARWKLEHYGAERFAMLPVDETLAPEMFEALTDFVTDPNQPGIVADALSEIRAHNIDEYLRVAMSCEAALSNSQEQNEYLQRGLFTESQ